MIITSPTTGIDQQGYETRERCEQHQATDSDCLAPGKTTFTLETAATQQAKHVNANPMSQQVDQDINDEIHFDPDVSLDAIALQYQCLRHDDRAFRFVKRVADFFKAKRSIKAFCGD